MNIIIKTRLYESYRNVIYNTCFELLHYKCKIGIGRQSSSLSDGLESHYSKQINQIGNILAI